MMRTISNPNGEFQNMTIPDNTQTLYEEDRATNDKVMATDVPALYAYKQFERQEERLAALEAQITQQNQQLFGSLQSERQQLFANTLGQQQALFGAALPSMARQWTDAVTISTKTLDLDTNEVNSQTVGAEVVAGLAPEIRQAIDAAVAKNVNLTGSADNAMAAAIAAAVVKALKDEG
jgi:ribosomal protein L9